jgi:hypothetical protein
LKDIKGAWYEDYLKKYVCCQIGEWSVSCHGRLYPLLTAQWYQLFDRWLGSHHSLSKVAMKNITNNSSGDATRALIP